MVHNGKCMSQSYVKIGDKGTHGKEHTSEPLVDDSQSVQLWGKSLINREKRSGPSIDP